MAEQPNVIVFFTDQQRWDTTGVARQPPGPHAELRPHRRSTARTWTTPSPASPSAAPPAPACRPGAMPRTPASGATASPCLTRRTTLAHYFNEAGYTTGYIGKWHLADEQAVPPEQQGGYDYWLAANVLEFCSEPYDTVMYDKRPAARSSCPATASTPRPTPRSATSTTTRTSPSSSSSPIWSRTTRTASTTSCRPTATASPTRTAGSRPIWRRWAARRSSTSPATTASSSGSTRPWAACWTRSRAWASTRTPSCSSPRTTAATSRPATASTSAPATRAASASRRPSPGRASRAAGGCHELVSLVDLPPTLLDAAGIDVPGSMHGRSCCPCQPHR